MKTEPTPPEIKVIDSWTVTLFGWAFYRREQPLELAGPGQHGISLEWTGPVRRRQSGQAGSTSTTLRLSEDSTLGPGFAAHTAETQPADRSATGEMIRTVGLEVTLEDPQEEEETAPREVEVIWEVVDQLS